MYDVTYFLHTTKVLNVGNKKLYNLKCYLVINRSLEKKLNLL